MSLATRRSASARCSSWPTSSRRSATATIVPMVTARTRAATRDRSSIVASGRGTRCRTPHGAARPGDGGRMLGPTARQDPERLAARAGRGHGPPAGIDRGPQDPVGRRHVHQPSRSGADRMRIHARHEPSGSDLPDDDEMVVVAVADEGRRGREVVVEVVAASGQPREVVEDVEVLGVAFDLERVGQDDGLRWRRTGPPAPARSFVQIRPTGAGLAIGRDRRRSRPRPGTAAGHPAGSVGRHAG